MSNKDQVTVTQAELEVARDWVLHNWPSWEIGAARAVKSIAGLLARHRLAQPASDREADEQRHTASVEMQEIADGAYGDGPRTRGAALAALTPSNRSDAVDGETALREAKLKLRVASDGVKIDRQIKALDEIANLPWASGRTTPADACDEMQAIARAALSNTGTTNSGGK